MRKIILVLSILLSFSLRAEVDGPERSALVFMLGFRYDTCASKKGLWEVRPDATDPRQAGQGLCFKVTCTIGQNVDLVDRCLHLKEAQSLLRNISKKPQAPPECSFDDDSYEYITCPNGDHYKRMGKSLVNGGRDAKNVDRYGPNKDVSKDQGLGM